MRYLSSRQFHRNYLVRQSGVVLFAVLLVIVVLALAAYQYSDFISSEARAANQIFRTAEARALADSGIHYTAGILANPDSFASILNNNPYDNPSAFQARSLVEGDSARKQGRFSIIALDYSSNLGGTGLEKRFGVMDECGKINLNAMMQLDSSGRIAHDMLLRLPNMSEEIVNAILDWIDPDETARSGGAESEYYASLVPPYRCKNAPLDSLEELLLVKGVTPQLLFGSDTNRNGQLDDNETASSGVFDTGLAPYLTVYSRERNVDAEGKQRINLNDQDLATLYTKLQGVVSAEVADFILAYRMFDLVSGDPPSDSQPGSMEELSQQVQQSVQGGRPRSRRNISSIFGLVNAKISRSSQQQGQQGQQGQTTKVYSSPLEDSSLQEEELPILFEMCTTQQAIDLPGRININTAPAAVLSAIPGLADHTDTLMQQRPRPNSPEASDPIYQTPAWLLTEAGLEVSTLQTIERYITGRSQVYRIQSVGYFDSSGPMVRIEAVIDTNGGQPRIIYYRDLTELGPVFANDLRGQ